MATRTIRMTRVCPLSVAGFVTALAMAIPPTGHTVASSTVPARPVATTTCVYVGPIMSPIDGQPIGPQVGVCAPTP
jgi:hypothetical protein